MLKLVRKEVWLFNLLTPSTFSKEALKFQNLSLLLQIFISHLKEELISLPPLSKLTEYQVTIPNISHQKYVPKLSFSSRFSRQYFAPKYDEHDLYRL